MKEKEEKNVEMSNDENGKESYNMSLSHKVHQQTKSSDTFRQ